MLLDEGRTQPESDSDGVTPPTQPTICIVMHAHILNHIHMHAYTVGLAQA